MGLTIQEILEAKTIQQGHFDNLKFENSKNRVWVSRMTVEDGAEFNLAITHEKLISGNWKIAQVLNPAVDSVLVF